MATPTPSLGQAISLGFKLPSNQFPLEEISRRRQEEQDAIDAAKKAAQKSKGLQDKYRNDLGKFNVEGIIAPLQGNSKAMSAAIIDHVKKNIASNPNYNPYEDSELDTMRFDLKQITARDRISSEAYLKDVEKGVQNPKSFSLQTQWTDAVGKNDKEAWDKLTGGTGVYTYGAITANEPEPDMPKLLGAMSGWAAKQGIHPTATGGAAVPIKTQESSWETFKQASPEWNATIVNWMTKGNTREQAEKAADEEFKPAYFGLFGEKAAPLKTGGKEGATSKYSVTPVTNKTININIPTIEDGKQVGFVEGEVTARNTWELKTTIPIQKETIETFDPTTWESERIVGAQDFKISSIIELPTIKGKPIRDKIAKQFSKQVKWKKFASGTTSKGEPKYIDYEAIKSVLEQKKITLEGLEDEKSKTINRSDISAKAKAAGYSNKEYEKLLIEKGVEIID